MGQLAASKGAKNLHESDDSFHSYFHEHLFLKNK